MAKKFSGILPVVFICLLSFLVLVSSINMNTPARDSGVFIAAGRGIINGDVPYLNFWDHKPPLVYYINAFSQLIGGSSLWGLWLTEFLSLSLALSVCFFFLKKHFGKSASFFGTMTAAILISKSIMGGNQVEEWALPLQFFILYVSGRKNFVDLEQNDLFILGILTGFLFLLKQNLFGVSFVVITLWMCASILNKRINRTFFKDMLFLTAGFILPLLIVFAYFYGNGAVFDFYDQTLRYNLIYSQSSLNQKISAILEGIKLFKSIWIFVFSSLIFSILFALVKSTKNIKIFLISTALLLSEILLSSTSGRKYHHYFISWIPAITILVTISYASLHKVFNLSGFLKKRILISVLIMFLLFFYANFSDIKIIASGLYFRRPITKDLKLRPFVFHADLGEQKETLAAISKFTYPNDTILVWGSESSIYFLSNRNSPTRYYYQFALFTQGYTSNDKISEFVDEIKRKKPKVIIDASFSAVGKEVTDTTVVPPLSVWERPLWFERNKYFLQFPAINDFYNLIDNNYILKESTYNESWDIYVLKFNRSNY